MLRDPNNLAEFFLQLVGAIVAILCLCGMLMTLLEALGLA